MSGEDEEYVFIKHDGPFVMRDKWGDPVLSMEEKRAAQDKSRLLASHHRQPWTGRDDAVLERDITDEQAAELLGRTVKAVNTRRDLIGATHYLRKPKQS